MRRPRSIAALAALALTGGMLTGCSSSPTTAATVNGTTITRDQVEQAYAGASQVLGDANQLSKAEVLTVMIQSVVAEDVAQRIGYTITNGDRDAKLSAAALAVPQARPFVYDVADTNLVAARVGTASLTNSIKAADVRINPRYGSWQPSTSVAVVAGTGSLSQVLQSSDQ